MQELFERITDMQEDKVTEVSLSYLEIYNETIRDLLVPGSSKGGLMLREDANQAVSVSGLSSHHPQNVSAHTSVIVPRDQKADGVLAGRRGDGYDCSRQRVPDHVTN